MTRMWLGVRPEELCDQHLRGEHAEMHQEVGTWKRHLHGEGVVQGHVKKGQVEPRMIDARHAELVVEMADRGMDHDSPLEAFDTLTMPDIPSGVMDGLYQRNRERLRKRCDECSERLRNNN